MGSAYLRPGHDHSGDSYREGLQEDGGRSVVGGEEPPTGAGGEWGSEYMVWGLCSDSYSNPFPHSPLSTRKTFQGILSRK